MALGSHVWDTLGGCSSLNGVWGVFYGIGLLAWVAICTCTIVCLRRPGYDICNLIKTPNTTILSTLSKSLLYSHTLLELLRLTLANLRRYLTTLRANGLINLLLQLLYLLLQMLLCLSPRPLKCKNMVYTQLNLIAWAAGLDPRNQVRGCRRLSR